jgi:DNA-binding transcriptional ArsR family regulator
MMVSPESLARAVGHPTRVRIIAALDDGPCGLPALAARVAGERRAVARHARVLEQAGMVQSTRSQQGTTYTLVSQLSFSDEEYGTLSDASREAAVAAALAHAHTAAAAALEGGGFEREDVHVSRTSLQRTEAQWRELSDEFARLLERIEARAVAEEDDATIRASAVLMLFERPGAGRAHVPAPHGDESFSISEGLERSWELSEVLERTLHASVTDWPAVVALADELRVLARTAMAGETRDGIAGREAAHAVTAMG